MTPIHLELFGSLGIKAGLGLDSIEVNLMRLVPEDAVTIAIKGDNGSGKSTLMNLGLVPWREPPVLPRDIYHEFGPKGEKILVWSHDGIGYKTEIQIRQSEKTKTQKAYLYRAAAEGDEWKPASFPDGLVSDGKVKTYDEALERVLGPQSLYYLSAFRGQGADKLAQHDDPKGLMRDLLGLDEVENEIGRVKLVVREITRELQAFQARADSVSSARQVLKELETSLTTEGKLLSELEAGEHEARDSVIIAEEDYKRVVSGEVEGLKKKAAYQKLVDSHEEAKRRVAEQGNEAQEAIRKARDDAKKAKDHFNERLARLTARIKAAEARKISAGEILNIAEEVEGAEKALRRLDDEIVALHAEREKLLTVRQEVAALQGDIRAKTARMEGIVSRGKSLKARLDELRIQHAFVDEVPCKGEGKYATCPALKDAIAAGEKIELVEADKKAQAVDWQALKKETDELSQKVSSLEASVDEQELTSSTKRLAEAGAEKTKAQQLAAKRSALAEAETVILQANNEIVEATREADAVKTFILEHDDASEKEISDIERKHAAVMERLEGHLAKVKKELDDTPEPGSQNESEAAGRALANARSAHEEARKKVAEKQGQIDAIRADVSKHTSIIEQSKRVEEYVKFVADEQSLYKILAVALRGVIDLTIEDAGPTIASTANELLEASYGGRFQISITTQRQNSVGELVECFDIEVYDTERDTRSSIIHKSGGESVWLDKALTDSVGLYHQMVSGQNYEVLFGDEVEDGLTAERKTMFYRMQRATMDQGGYKRLYFVSHNPEAWAVADAVIDMGTLT